MLGGADSTSVYFGLSPDFLEPRCGANTLTPGRFGGTAKVVFVCRIIGIQMIDRSGGKGGVFLSSLRLVSRDPLTPGEAPSFSTSGLPGSWFFFPLC